ncbi:glycoside hydrolase family 30 beta sandwich domain-containing protein [Streptomyces sp. WAC04114]|uniref:glycoside hydrolase family 30 beta sandwich domain-containing protein n=1 Tax=Streptomyces sp. WAC04114 TaxID=2867961 RepID=UPI0027E129FF|nr:glycoside hydrolase family 30 beta sandwich domain-containing protein [Streptomyces sp. WAC04114]
MVEYCVLGHLSKFVEPAAVRIGSTSQGADGVRNVTFENPDGSRAAYVVNSASSAQTFSLTDGGKPLSYPLPAGAVATFVWEQDGTTPPPTGTVDPSRWYQVVNTHSGKCLDATGGGPETARPCSSGRA